MARYSIQHTKVVFHPVEPVLGKALSTGLLCCDSEADFKVVCNQAELSREGSYIKL